MNVSCRHAICLAVALVMAGACGSSGGEPVAGTSTADTAGDLSTFCDSNEELNTLQRPPTDAELSRLEEAAPPEMKQDVDILVASAKEFRASGGESEATEEAQAAGRRLDAYVEENCEGPR